MVHWGQPDLGGKGAKMTGVRRGVGLMMPCCEDGEVGGVVKRPWEEDGGDETRTSDNPGEEMACRLCVESEDFSSELSSGKGRL